MNVNDINLQMTDVNDHTRWVAGSGRVGNDQVVESGIDRGMIGEWRMHSPPRIPILADPRRDSGCQSEDQAGTSGWIPPKQSPQGHTNIDWCRPTRLLHRDRDLIS